MNKTTLALMGPAFDAAPFPVLACGEDGRIIYSNGASRDYFSAAELGGSLADALGAELAARAASGEGERSLPCSHGGFEGRAELIADGALLLAPSIAEGMADATAVADALRYLADVCRLTEPDTAAEALLVACGGEPLESASRGAQKCLRRVSQTCRLIGFIERREERPNDHGRLSELVGRFGSRLFEALNGTGCTLMLAPPFGGGLPSCYREADIETAVCCLTSSALALSGDRSAALTLGGEGDDYRISLAFRTDRTALDIDKLVAVPKSGERDLSFPLLGEIARANGGELRFESSGGEGRLSLSFNPTSGISDSGLFMNEMLSVEELTSTAFLLEFAEL